MNRTARRILINTSVVRPPKLVGNDPMAYVVVVPLGEPRRTTNQLRAWTVEQITAYLVHRRIPATEEEISRVAALLVWGIPNQGVRAQASLVLQQLAVVRGQVGSVVSHITRDGYWHPGTIDECCRFCPPVAVS